MMEIGSVSHLRSHMMASETKVVSVYLFRDTNRFSLPDVSHRIAKNPKANVSTGHTFQLTQYTQYI